MLCLVRSDDVQGFERVCLTMFGIILASLSVESQ